MIVRGSSLFALSLAAASIALAIGCSDPGNGVLPAGVNVILSDGTDQMVPAWVVGASPGTLADSDRIELPAGTRAVVVKDEVAGPSKEQALRLTRVRLLDGPRARSEVEVVRYKLRPPR